MPDDLSLRATILLNIEFWWWRAILIIYVIRYVAIVSFNIRSSLHKLNKIVEGVHGMKRGVRLYYFGLSCIKHCVENVLHDELHGGLGRLECSRPQF